MITFKVEGLKELDKALRDFGPKVAKNGLRSANYAATKIILTAVKATTAWKDVSGDTRANIVSPRRRGPDNVAKHSISFRSGKKAKVTAVAKHRKNAKNISKNRVGKYHAIAGPALRARFLEFGTSRMRARPFLRPAFLANVKAAIEADRLGLVKAVERAAKKAGK